MKHELYAEVELLTDVPKFGLERGDIAKIIDTAGEAYVLEAFNVFGDTLGVFILPDNQIRPLNKNMVFKSRDLKLVS